MNSRLDMNSKENLVMEMKVKNAQRITEMEDEPYDSLTGKVMADTKFEVYLDTVIIGTYETNAKGEIKLYDLKPGTYTVTEVATDGEHIIQ